MSEQELLTTRDLSSLKPYHGYQSSIIPLSRGYYFYLASWDSTPTQFSRFSNVWLVTPENKRFLFSDPPASSEIVCICHLGGRSYQVANYLQNQGFKLRNSVCGGSHHKNAVSDERQDSNQQLENRFRSGRMAYSVLINKSKGFSQSLSRINRGGHMIR